MFYNVIVYVSKRRNAKNDNLYISAHFRIPISVPKKLYLSPQKPMHQILPYLCGVVYKKGLCWHFVLSHVQSLRKTLL